MALFVANFVTQVERDGLTVMIVNELFAGLAPCESPFEPPSFLVLFGHLLNIISRRLGSCKVYSHRDSQ
jgi:hypothetical protein